MSNRYQQVFIFILLSFYCLLVYFIVNHLQRVDFSSFYMSSQAFSQGENPYINFYTTFLPSVKILPANLNPPFVLWGFNFLTRFSYSHALLIWLSISFISGLIGITIAFYYAFSRQFLQNHYATLYLLYFAFFPTLMSLATQQFGGILLFLIMVGYHFYLKRHDYVAGICWGIIIAIKLFPALLFFYVLKQNRKRVFATMLLTFCIAVFFPLFHHGSEIYQHYFRMMRGVFWYGDNWNASVYGFIFRLCFGGEKLPDMWHLKLVNLLQSILFLILLFWYWRKMGTVEKGRINHQPFCFTLAMMLLLSPFGWLYYFPLLIFPMILIWFAALKEKGSSQKTVLIWLISLFLLNFPVDYVNSQLMTHVLVRVSFYSTFFYGLVLLIYLLGRKQKIYGNNEIQFDGTLHYSIPVIRIIFIFGVFVPVIYYLARIFNLFFGITLISP
ncbi:DUF2029 domain-containing protein [Fluoribacter dumoffii]|uniref:glycosyltransferase family 87 protein n=1 Tax=Fluoribacter dumoffii TaxID=463 RepID=UPI0022436B25|nr:glycosyltransferase family 87 protein [Fluoribacter dumoffii]MCW8386553.1 DUF2029 domain-containing protein [Fluoribacter dumoffii]MCW8498174.1 DUF2029 domain-containing protein [Fluoribacter dumoffii]